MTYGHQSGLRGGLEPDFASIFPSRREIAGPRAAGTRGRVLCTDGLSNRLLAGTPDV
jgi:hypothetical protein